MESPQHAADSDNQSNSSSVSKSKTQKPTRSSSRLKRPRSSLGSLTNLSGDEGDARSSSRPKTRRVSQGEDANGSTQDIMQTVNELPSPPKKIGEISLIPKDWCITRLSTSRYTYKWAVQNFSLFTSKTKEALSSSKIKIPQFGNLEFDLHLYPNGHEEKCENNVCIALQCLAQEGLDIDCKLMLLNSSGTKITNYKTQPCNKYSNSKICYCVTTKSKLIKLLSNDVLVVLCTLSITENIQKTSVDDENHTQELQNELEVLSDLYKLTMEKEFCDVILSIENQEFFAHRAILAVRCPFFGQMFEHYKGQNIEKFEIERLVKPSVFEEVLKFIYTGKLLDIKSALYNELFDAAYKFDIPSLKTMCERYLIENLSLDNVIQNLILADKLGGRNLKEKAKNFIAGFSVEIANSPDFFKNLNFDLYQEILCLLLNE